MNKLATTVMGLGMLVVGVGCGSAARPELVDPSAVRSSGVTDAMPVAEYDCMPGEYEVTFTAPAAPAAAKRTPGPASVALRADVAKKGVLLLGQVQ